MRTVMGSEISALRKSLKVARARTRGNEVAATGAGAACRLLSRSQTSAPLRVGVERRELPLQQPLPTSRDLGHVRSITCYEEGVADCPSL